MGRGGRLILAMVLVIIGGYVALLVGDHLCTPPRRSTTHSGEPEALESGHGWWKT